MGSVYVMPLEEQDALILNVLRDAGQYFHIHENATVVLYIDQLCFQQEQIRLHQLFDDVALLCSLKLKFIIIFSPFCAGTPFPIDNNLVLQQSLDQILHKKNELECFLARSAYKYLHASAVVSGNFIIAKPYGIIDGCNYGSFGRVRHVEFDSLKRLQTSHPVVVIAPIGISPNGEMFVLDGLEVAQSVAAQLKVKKLIFLSAFAYDLPREMSVRRASAYLDEHIGSHEQVFLKSAVEVAKKVGRVHFLDIRTAGCLLMEVLTRDGVGVMITEEQYDLLRTGTLADVALLKELIAPFEQAGILVERSQQMLESDIDLFTLMFRDGALIGCVAFYPYADDKMGELACLVIHADYRQGRKANVLLEHVEQFAKNKGFEHIFLLTTQTAHWFIENGFKLVEKEQLPAEKLSNYNFRRNSQVLMKTL